MEIQEFIDAACINWPGFELENAQHEGGVRAAHAEVDELVNHRLVVLVAVHNSRQQPTEQEQRQVSHHL
jgi:hypothetical protein